MVEPRHTIAVLTAAICTILAGCAAPGDKPSSGAKKDGDANDVIARLSGNPLTQAEFEWFATAVFPPERISTITNSPEERAAAIEAWLDFRVQVAKAHKEGIPELSTYQQAVRLMEMKLLVGDLVDRNRPFLLEPSAVPEAEVREYYQTHTNLFQLRPGGRPEDRQPLDQVREEIAGGIAQEENARFNQQFLENLRDELHLVRFEAVSPSGSLLDSNAVAPNVVLASIGDTRITESDFQWFLKDAYRAEQRQQAFSRPGARRQLLEAFLNMRLMEAKARKLGLNNTPEHQHEMSLAEDRLLVEFLQERTRTAPWLLPGATEEERMAASRKYMDNLRQEMNLEVLTGQPVPNRDGH